MAEGHSQYDYYTQRFEHLDRALNRPQLAGIGITGCIGAGIFLTSGSLIAITGSLGAVIRQAPHIALSFDGSLFSQEHWSPFSDVTQFKLQDSHSQEEQLRSYIIAGGIVASVMYSLTEMVTCRPLTGALIEIPHKFLDPAWGFAVGLSYTLANICSMATLTAQSAELTALLKDVPKRHDIGTEVGINVFFIALTTFTHCLGVRIYGKIERIIMWFKLSLIVLVCILMIVINAGGGGPREGSYNRNYTTHGFTPGWKPIGFDSTEYHLLRSTSVDDTGFGMGGSGGKAFAFLTAVSISMFSVMGGEMVGMAASESKQPFRDIPIVMSFVYVVPLSLYPLAMLAGGSNVNFADPNLPKLWRSSTTISRSPFVIAVESTAMHGLPKALNLFFIISAYTAANTALYVASRAIFTISQMYMPTKIANTFGRTNNGHTPLAAILLCSALGFLSLVGLSEYAFSQPRITLSELYTGSIASIYICLCFTFLRFKAGLDRLAKRKLLSRDDALYASRLFKSRWQPLPAYIGIIGCSFVVLWYGIAPLYILACIGKLTSTVNLKSSVALAFDIVGAYIGPLLFVTFYLVYKYIAPRSFRVDLRDLTPGHYVIGDLGDLEEEYPSRASRKPSKASTQISDLEPRAFELASPPQNLVSSKQVVSEGTSGDRVSGNENNMEEMNLSPELLDEMEAQRARKEERDRIQAILEMRPNRMGRGFWRELWSFVIAD